MAIMLASHALYDVIPFCSGSFYLYYFVLYGGYFVHFFVLGFCDRAS